ncbi:MAG: Ig-like domain-containing protein, partial [Propionibacteriaceae bacterium]|nr:Ig-like domain-containing protein [Propionibacteriaceae bacterium]
GNPVPDAVVTFAVGPAGPVFAPQATCRTDDKGVCTTTLTSTRSGTYAVTAAIAAGPVNTTTGGAAASVAWTAETVCSAATGCEPKDPGLPADKRTRVEVTQDNQVADGSSRDLATVWAFDWWGNPVEGALVSSVAADPALWVQAGIAPIGKTGAATVGYWTTVAGTYDAAVTVDGVAVPGSPVALTFRAGTVCVVEAGCTPGEAGTDPARQTRVAVTTDGQPVDGAPDQVTAYAYDKAGNPAPGVTFDFAAGAGVTMGPSCVTGDDGTCGVSAAARVAGTYQATASVAGVELSRHGSPLALTFVAGAPCVIEAGCTPEGPGTDPARQTRVAVTTNDQPVGGWDVITAYAYDRFGNPVGGQVFSLGGVSGLTFAGGGTNVVVTTADAGSATVRATAELGGSYPVRASAGGAELTAHGSPLDVRFLTVPTITSPHAGDLTSQDPLVIAGTGQTPGDTVTVQDGGQVVCWTTVGADYHWSCSVALDDGDHSLTAVETTPDGHDSAPSEPVGVSVDTVAPVGPVITSPAAGAAVGTDRPTLTGTATEPGGTVTVSDGDKVLCTTTVQSDLSWSCPVTTPLGEGDHVLTATQTDPAGNVSNQSGPVTIVVDTVAPVSPVITEPTPGSSVGTDRPTVTGTATEPGGTVTVSDGDKVLCTTTVAADLSWSCPVPTPLGEGDHVLTATQTDPAGNVSDRSDPVAIVVDVTAPVVPTVDPSNGSQISGTAEPGTTVTVIDESGGPVVGCEAVVPDPDGRFSCRPGQPLAPGAEVTVVVTDPAGNQSEPVRVTIAQLVVEVTYPTRHPLETQTVTGRHFNPGERVCLTIAPDRLEVGCAAADSEGTVTYTFTVPGHWSVGPRTAALQGDMSGRVEAPFAVIVTIEVKTGGLVRPAPAEPGLFGLIAITTKRILQR